MLTWMIDVRDFASAVLDQPAAASCCYADAHSIVNGDATPRTMADALARLIERLHAGRCLARLYGDRQARTELSALHRRALALMARLPLEATETHAVLTERGAELHAIVHGGPLEHLRDSREPEGV